MLRQRTGRIGSPLKLLAGVGGFLTTVNPIRKLDSSGFRVKDSGGKPGNSPWSRLAMQPSEETRPSLLLRIRDGRDAEAWRDFARIYGPPVYRIGQRRGLQDADAAILVQNVLWKVARSIQHFDYDPQRGSFRGWLLTVTRSQLHELFAQQRRQMQATGDTAVREAFEQQALESEEDCWEREHRKSLFDWAVEQIRGRFQPSTWQAFWQTAVDGNSTQQVAQSLNMTVGAVYIARSRVLASLKKQIENVQDQ
jgi:RNA polymerase sigma factor (sigma-70 family)